MTEFRDMSGRPSPAAWERAQGILRQPVVVGPDGYVETLPASFGQTLSQRALDTRITAWAYDRGRERLMRLAGMADFPTEVGVIGRALRPGPGDVIVDLACGQGSFTIEWARLAGADGLVIGLDYSTAMLRRAAARVRRSGLDNIVLVHADAQDLPLADGSVDRVNCSGGFHAFPDLPQAVGEIARVARPTARLTASTFAEAPGDRRAAVKRWLNRSFALHFVPLGELEDLLAENGFAAFEWSQPKGAFSYTSAIKGEPRSAGPAGETGPAGG